MDNDRYLSKAKLLTASEYNRWTAERRTPLAPTDFYVVWFAKTLDNWKALVSTDAVNGLYFEVTYNGAKQETYVDIYNKCWNARVPD